MLGLVRYVAPPAAAAEDAEIRPCGLCLQCVQACPTGALQYVNRTWTIDLARCAFCRACATVCPNQLITGEPM